MRVAVRPVPGLPPPEMRAGYLAALEEPQEAFLERRVADGATWQIEQDGGLAGYAVIDQHGTLLELFYAEQLMPAIAELFGMLTAAAGVKSCLYQSFDPGMRRVAAAIRAQVEPIGILFRGIRDPHHEPRSDLSMRPASEADLRAITDMDDGFFANVEEVSRHLNAGRLSVLEGAASHVIGCGLAEPVMPNGTAIDIGMLVSPASRRQGYGTFIGSHLKSQILSLGLRPICGCAIGNVGSQRTIQNAGFVADHRLFQFKI